MDSDKTLINASTNSSIGKHAPSDYLKDIAADKLEPLLKSHLLVQASSSGSPLLFDDFEEFLAQRQEIFARLIAIVTGATFDSVSKVVRAI